MTAAEGIFLIASDGGDLPIGHTDLKAADGLAEVAGAMVDGFSVLGHVWHLSSPFASAPAPDWVPPDWVPGADTAYELVTNEAVLEELGDGEYPSSQAVIELIQHLPLLAATPAVAEIVDAYVQHHLMPADPTGDALHLALASFHKCDFLITWNCQHLANANKFGHIRRVNGLLGLYVPELVTPLELLGLGSRVMTISRNGPVLDDGDEEIARIRAARHRFSECFEHDPYPLVAHYMERQEAHRDRLIHAPQRETANLEPQR